MYIIASGLWINAIVEMLLLGLELDVIYKLEPPLSLSTKAWTPSPPLNVDVINGQTLSLQLILPYLNKHWNGS